MEKYLFKCQARVTYILIILLLISKVIDAIEYVYLKAAKYEYT